MDSEFLIKYVLDIQISFFAYICTFADFNFDIGMEEWCLQSH